MSVKRGAPLRDGGMWMGQECVVQYEHPLCLDRCSFVKLPACRLEWCIAAKTQRGNQQWISSPPGRGPRWTRASLGDLQMKGVFTSARSAESN